MCNENFCASHFQMWLLDAQLYTSKKGTSFSGLMFTYFFFETSLFVQSHLKITITSEITGYQNISLRSKQKTLLFTYFFLYWVQRNTQQHPPSFHWICRIEGHFIWCSASFYVPHKGCWLFWSVSHLKWLGFFFILFFHITVWLLSLKLDSWLNLHI